MASDQPTAEIRALLRQIGLEMAFLEPDRPSPLLGELFDRLAAAVAEGTEPAFGTAVAAGRSWLGGGADGLGDRLAAWHAWMEEAVTAMERHQPLPAWTSLGAAGTPAPAPSPPPAAPLVTGSRPARPAIDEAAECQAVTVLPEGHDDELMRMFCVEAEELLAEIEAGVLVLEQTPADESMLATVFRGFHTLKGNAAVMKLVVLQRLTHELESLLDAARRGRRQLDRAAIDAILAGADVVSRYVAETTRQLDGHDAGRSIPLPVPAVIDLVHRVLASPVAVSPPATPVPAASPAGNPEPPASPQPAAATASEPAVALPTTPPEPPPPPPPLPGLSERPRAAASTGSSVRVDTHKLDGLVDLVGELVIAQSMVVQAAESGGGDELLA
ncbi:MAG: hypothetical protein RLZZ440_297, partial [Planctomycetota bacterium]